MLKTTPAPVILGALLLASCGQAPQADANVVGDEPQATVQADDAVSLAEAALENEVATDAVAEPDAATRATRTARRRADDPRADAPGQQAAGTDRP